MNFMNFWNKLPKPFFILAPMDGVTDTVFRQIVASQGKPDVFFTEFVPVEAILSKKGHKAIEQPLRYSENERPIVAQIWGSNPEYFYKSAQIIKKLGFDGIDINMGCPDKSAVKKGACAALIKNPKLAKEIIHSTIKGAGGLPVSVKTRIGFSSMDTENWVRELLQTPISALILHLRTVVELSKVPAHWDEISKAVRIRDELKSKALIVGNGDIESLEEAREKCKLYGIDSAMIGRGIFNNVRLFNDTDNRELTSQQKIELLVKHLRLFKKIWGENRHFELMKKFVKCYVNNYRGAFDDRERLMRTKKLDELILVAKEIQKSNVFDFHTL